MAAGESGHVDIAEVSALLREATRLVSDGSAGVTAAERESYQLRKADLLARVAACHEPADQRDTAPRSGESGGGR